jgi:hypothetical protein
LSLYGVAPDDATFAEGPCLLTNTKGGNWNRAPGLFVVKNSLTNKTYVNTEQVILPPWPGSGPFPTQTVNFRAVEAGNGSTSTAGTIDQVVSGENGVTLTPSGTRPREEPSDSPPRPKPAFKHKGKPKDPSKFKPGKFKPRKPGA